MSSLSLFWSVFLEVCWSKKKKNPKEAVLRFIGFPYCFSIFNFIDFCSYLYHSIPSACFGFILLSFLQVLEVGA